MADNPNKCFSRSHNNTRGRGAQRDCFGSRPPLHYQEYAGDETITIRNTNLSPRSNGRIGGSNRNRISSSRNRFERMQNRRSDSYNRQVHQSSVNNHEIGNEHTQDNKENALQVTNDKNVNSGTTQQSSSTKANNNIGSLINRNSLINPHDAVTTSQRESTSDGTTPNSSEEESSSQLPIRNSSVINPNFFYLPKRELNLSPTRITPIPKEQTQQSPPSSTSDSTQGATSNNLNSGCAPSTSSNSFEASGTCPRAITKRNEAWINAPEFHPKSHVKACVEPKRNLEAEDSLSVEKTICPVIQKAGVCRLLPYCPYLHGENCDLCNYSVLHPTDEEQRMRHRQQCLERHERNMELSFAIARSREKTCGICFEIVVEKDSFDRRFGILNQCNHCFCLSCIRRWRQARQFEHKVVKACPECRVTSDFVCPSQYWVETKEDKEKLIESYKKVLAQKACKYFKQGRGVCPFGNKCFYLHALPDGTKTDVGPPRRRNNRPRDERILGIDLDLIVWDLNNEIENHWPYTFTEDVDDLAAFFSDSDDSDMADYECSFQ